jgi:hypothetical protein
MDMAVRHELAVMGTEGDTKTLWDPDNETEVSVAKAAFDALRKKNYSIFHVKKDGEAGSRMDTFDPRAGKLVAVPPIVGG